MEVQTWSPCGWASPPYPTPPNSWEGSLLFREIRATRGGWLDVAGFGIQAGVTVEVMDYGWPWCSITKVPGQWRNACAYTHMIENHSSDVFVSSYVCSMISIKWSVELFSDSVGQRMEIRM